MKETPNSLIIYIPLFLKDKIEFPEPSNLIPFKLYYCIEEYFGKVQTHSICKILPLNRGNQKLKKYFHNLNLPNKINVSLDLIYIQSKLKIDGKKDYFYFFRFEIYSSNTDINYIKFINYYYDNRNSLLEFLLSLIRYISPLNSFISTLIQKRINDLILIYFNVIYYTYKNVDEIKDLKRIYFTSEEIVKNERHEIYADLQGRIIMILNNMTTKKSGSNLKLFGLRAFLLRTFTWVYQKNIEFLPYLMYDFFNFADYLMIETRYKQIYRNFIQLRNYCLAYGSYQFQDNQISILNESEKTWKILIKFLNEQLNITSIHENLFNQETKFNEFIYEKLKLRIPNIILNQNVSGGHMDLSVGNQVAIEVKKIESKTPFDELTGQIKEDLRIFSIKFGIAFGIDYTKNQLYIRHNTHTFGITSNIIYIIKPYPYLKWRSVTYSNSSGSPLSTFFFITWSTDLDENIKTGFGALIKKYNLLDSKAQLKEPETDAITNLIEGTEL